MSDITDTDEDEIEYDETPGSLAPCQFGASCDWCYHGLLHSQAVADLSAELERERIQNRELTAALKEGFDLVYERWAPSLASSVSPERGAWVRRVDDLLDLKRLPARAALSTTQEN